MSISGSKSNQKNYKYWEIHIAEKRLIKHKWCHILGCCWEQRAADRLAAVIPQPAATSSLKVSDALKHLTLAQVMQLTNLTDILF